MAYAVTRVASGRFHQWLVPERTVVGLLAAGLVLAFVGAILLGVASFSTRVFWVVGGILLALGVVALIVVTCLCVQACCFWQVHDRDTQTIETTIITADQADGDWYAGFGDKRVPNGVLRDSRQVGSLNKKHVTISPRGDSVSSGYMSGRPADASLRSADFYSGSHVGKSPGTPGSNVSTLASFAYLQDPAISTPYSTINQRQQNHPGVHGTQSGYGSVPRNASEGRFEQVHQYQHNPKLSPRSNVLPGRRHSDDDYDNALVSPMLPQQTYQPPVWQQDASTWQQRPQQVRDSGQYSQSWQHAPQQQTVWQYQTSGGSPGQAWHPQPARDDIPPPAQPLVRPSQRRPMTFEQISNSKVSLYDNMLMNRPDEE